ncbi:MAG TPA: AAA family ATPase, partial [Verrucomicrobiae bacterium]
HSIAKEALTGLGWEISWDFNSRFIQSVKKGFAIQPIWFSNQTKKLIDGISWTFSSSSVEPSKQLAYVFENKFSQQLSKTILIPAKRRLETSKQINAFDSINANGTGVLNFLFSAKNQDETSNLRQQFDTILHAFLEISAGYEFDVFLQVKNANPTPSPTFVELRFRRKGSPWIHAADCGLGLQELLIILYFALASEHEVVLIEEPENHLHPEIQRRLIAFLREKTEKQFFLSTHSSVFLNTQFADRVFTCQMTDSIHIENVTSRAAALTALGYSIADNLVSDLVVLCEGPKDKLVLEEFFQKMGLPEKANIKVWPLGGDIMDQLDLSVFLESHKLMALIDNDPGSSTIRTRFQKKCEELKVPVTRLKRYAIENYFSLAAISAYMKGQMPAGMTEIAPDKPVAEQLGFEVKKNGGKIAKEMKLEDLKGTDLEEFLNQVAKLAIKEHVKSVPSTN